MKNADFESYSEKDTLKNRFSTLQIYSHNQFLKIYVVKYNRLGFFEYMSE